MEQEKTSSIKAIINTFSANQIIYDKDSLFVYSINGNNYIFHSQSFSPLKVIGVEWEKISSESLNYQKHPENFKTNPLSIIYISNHLDPTSLHNLVPEYKQLSIAENYYDLSTTSLLKNHCQILLTERITSLYFCYTRVK
jgi:hypothetical protein